MSHSLPDCDDKFIFIINKEKNKDLIISHIKFNEPENDLKLISYLL